MPTGGQKVLEYFINHTNERFADLKGEVSQVKSELAVKIDAIQKELKELNQYRWKAAGVWAGVTFVSFAVVEVIRLVIGGR